MMNTLFSPNGRINPAQFKSGAIILIAIGALINILPLLSVGLAMIVGVLGIAILWPWVMLFMKRSRDAGKSGWFSLVPLIAMVVVGMIASMLLMPMFIGNAADMTAQMEAAGETGDMGAVMDAMGSLAKKTAIPSAIMGAITSAIVAFGFNAMMGRDGDNHHGAA